MRLHLVNSRQVSAVKHSRHGSTTRKSTGIAITTEELAVLNRVCGLNKLFGSRLPFFDPVLVVLSAYARASVQGEVVAQLARALSLARPQTTARLLPQLRQLRG